MKHNKKRNTAFLYEALILEMTRCIVNKDEERKKIALSILKESFSVGSILRDELGAYRAINETAGVPKGTADAILREAQRTYLSLHPQHVFKQQTKVIKRVNKELGKDTFNIFMPNYKNLATINQLFSIKTPVKRRVMLEETVVENMTSLKEKNTMEPIDNLVYNVFVKKFNEKYDNLLEEQKDLLFKYIFSFADEGTSLKVTLNEEIHRMKEIIKENKDIMPALGDKFESLEKLLESYAKSTIDDQMILKVMQTQDFCKEL
jgi:hypothetical protein|tara:strand:- start:1369 stop:2154 length:786 start_codon:yes stop_codon:yes gene_type:complete